MSVKHRSAYPRPLCSIVIVLLGCLSTGTCIAADERDDSLSPYFQSLRDRRLFHVAEHFCEHRLTADKNSPSQRIELAVELAKTYREHAKLVAAPDSHGLRDRAKQLLTDHDRQTEQLSLNLEIRLTLWSHLLEDIQDVRFDLDFAPAEESFRRRGLAACQQLLDSTRLTTEEISARQKDKSDEAHDLTATQRKRVEALIQLRSSQADVALAEFSNDRTPEQLSRLSRAQKRLKKVSETGGLDELSESAAIWLAIATRLSGDERSYQGQIAALKRRKKDDDFKHELWIEIVRGAILGGRFQEALSEFASAEKTSLIGDRLAESEWIKGMVLVNLWRSSSQRKQNASGAYTNARNQLATVSPFENQIWNRRFQHAVELLEEEESLGIEVAPLAYQGRSCYLSGELAKSSEHYRNALQIAEQRKATNAAYAISIRLASIEIERQRFTAAAEVLEEVIHANPKHKRTEEAFLLAIYARGREWTADRNTQSLERYRYGLERFLENYSESNRVVEAEWMLAELLNHLRSYEDAIQHYLKIPREHARGVAARRAVAQCYLRWLPEIRTELGSLRKYLNLAHRQLDPSRIETNDDLTKNDASARLRDRLELTLALVSLDLIDPAPDLVKLEAELDRVDQDINEIADALTSRDDLEPTDGMANEVMPLRNRAVRLRIIVQVRQSRFAEARKYLDQAAQRPPSELLAVLEELSEEKVDPRTNSPLAGLADLKVQTGRRLNTRRSELTVQEQRRVDVLMARAHHENGQTDEAVALYDHLIHNGPRDFGLIREFADLLLRSRKADQQLRGVSLLRQAESKEKPGTESWLEARLSLIEGLSRIGQAEDALKLIKKTRLLHNKSGTDEQKERLNRLESSIRK